MTKGAASASDYIAGLRFSHGQGAHCWTTDGRKYIDLICGQGPIVLGHGHPAVSAAVAQQLDQGTLLPGPGPGFYKLRDILVQLYPRTDDMLTFKTGSEAVAAAIRLARAHTGRSTIVRVGFHGWHDQVVSPYVRCHSYDPATFDISWPDGVPHAAHRDLVRVWHGSDPRELLSIVRDIGHELAAVIVDPVQIVPVRATTAAPLLADALREAGALLIFDESKTGFRTHLGGAQALYGVAADITVLSKALANGLPLAAVLARRQLIELGQRARIKGTFGAETASIAAALATIEILRSMDAPRLLNQRGAELIEGLSNVIRLAGLQEHITALPYHWPCMPYVHFSGEKRGLQDAFHRGLVDRGVLMLRDHMSYISLALTTTDVENIVAAAADVLEELAKASPAS